MKILLLSDLHFEFREHFFPERLADADVLVLAGDIVGMRHPVKLQMLLELWDKPVLYVAGNHEYYYTDKKTCEKPFALWLRENCPQLIWLRDEAVTLDGVHFFGGTMWTDLRNGDHEVIDHVRTRMNDFVLIQNGEHSSFSPEESISLYKQFRTKLENWLQETQGEKRVVISHHAPVAKPQSRHSHSLLSYAFHATNMESMIMQYQPDLWLYGHTHESAAFQIGNTKLYSNQSGYLRGGQCECTDFQKEGLVVQI